MMPGSRKTLKEVANILFCGFLVIMSLFLLNDLSKVKMSPFDYLASSAVPSVLCWALIFLTSIVFARSLIALARANNGDVVEDPQDTPSTTLQLALVGAISIVYVVTIIFSLVPYAVSTTLMLASCMAILAPKDKWNWWLILGLSITVGGGCAYVFTEILPMPFPGF
mgnify:FL=1